MGGDACIRQTRIPVWLIVSYLMTRLYADKQFPREVVELLRPLGHDILTVQEAGNTNQGIPDEAILSTAATPGCLRFINLRYSLPILL